MSDALRPSGSSPSVSQHTIAGTVLTMPVKIRQAQQHLAMFSVDADAAQRMIDYSGLQVCRYRPGRAVVILMLMHYIDGDLGQYYEYGTNVMVNPPGSNASGLRALQSAGAFIHHLPVDQAFTLEAGTTIWGFPKVMADFTIRDGRKFGFDISVDGKLVAGMDFSLGLPVPSVFTSRTQAQRSYSYRDGVTREIPFEMSLTDVRYRLGGARVRLGDHPYAKELASLGLPKRAMVSSSVGNVEMSFRDAHVVEVGR
ncbi:MAG TPA: acetoacetate decarboxylase family protein [Mycobacterium sp.]